MKQSEYIKRMEAGSLVMKEIELNKVAINSIKTRVDVVDITDAEYNKAMTKKRFLEEHNAELSHQKRIIEAEVFCQLQSNITDDGEETPDLFDGEVASDEG